MNALNTILEKTVGKFESSPFQQHHELNELLLALCKWGSPRVSKTGSGWHSRIEVHVNMTGTSFEVKSEFDHPTPIAAALECQKRLYAALKNLGVQP